MNMRLGEDQVDLLKYQEHLVYRDLFNIYIVYLPRVLKICKETGMVSETYDLSTLPLDVKEFAVNHCKKALKQLNIEDEPLEKLKMKLINLGLYDLAADAREAQVKYEGWKN